MEPNLTEAPMALCVGLLFLLIIGYAISKFLEYRDRKKRPFKDPQLFIYAPYHERSSSKAQPGAGGNQTGIEAKSVLQSGVHPPDGNIPVGSALLGADQPEN